MGDWIYVLTAKGRLARTGAASSVPPQLRRLLTLIDGRRSRDDVLAIVGRSAVNAGGLSLLVTGGYIERRVPDQAAPTVTPAAAPKVPAKKKVVPKPVPAAEPAPRTRPAPAVAAPTPAVVPAPPARPAERPPALVAERPPAPSPKPAPVPTPVAAKRPPERADTEPQDVQPTRPAAMKANSTIAPALSAPPAAAPSRPVAAASARTDAAKLPTAVKADKLSKPGRLTQPQQAVSPEKVAVKPARRATLLSMHGYLATYMVETIGRWLSEDDGDVHLYRIERAQSMAELLPLIEPLIDAVLKAAGPEAAADFADGAASILEPSTRPG